MSILNGIEVLCHSSIRINKDVTIYVDPYKVNKDYNDADYVFCTHEHYDHFSPEDIKRIIKKDTVIITVQNTLQESMKIQPDRSKIILVGPNESYDMKNIKFETTVAYNENKLFHQKSKKWVGYIITLKNERYYISGDTDDLPELENVKCDVAFVPVGGTYTMNYREAANLVNNIHPKIAIPTHYGLIVGSKEDAEKFKKNVLSDIKVEFATNYFNN